VFALLGVAPHRASATPPAPAAVRLYAIDCGKIEFSDMSAYADTGEYDGRSASMVAPCYLVAHPSGYLLWDTGLGDPLADLKGGLDAPPLHASVEIKLADQLSALGVGANDVTYVAFSHLHLDHTGNASAFGASTWIMNKRELAWARSDEGEGLVSLVWTSTYEAAKKLLINGDHDVFGDGSVRILRMPGHTPGHQVLLLKLARAGHIILAGDLFHTKENEREGRVPVTNVNRADTLASFERLRRLARVKQARVFVQHAPEDFAALPRFPSYLD
jgi:N-acyl homoserine lactone hydrolase